MPVLSPVGAEILIASVTIVWGILIETWFVSRLTIFFNIVPMIALLATFDSDSGVVGFMALFLFISFLLVGISGWKWAKHLVGAKGYGVFALTFGLIEAKIVPSEQFIPILLVIGFGVGLVWLMVYWVKDQHG